VGNNINRSQKDWLLCWLLSMIYLGHSNIMIFLNQLSLRQTWGWVLKFQRPNIIWFPMFLPWNHCKIYFIFILFYFIFTFFVSNSNVVWICPYWKLHLFFCFCFFHLLPEVGWWWNKRTFWTCTRVLFYIIFSSLIMLL